MPSFVPIAVVLGLVFTLEIGDHQVVPGGPVGAVASVGVESVLLDSELPAEYSDLVALATKPRQTFPGLRAFNSVSLPTDPNDCSAGGSMPHNNGSACSTDSGTCSAQQTPDRHCSAQGGADLAFCSATNSDYGGAGQCSALSGDYDMHCSSRGHEFTWCSAQGSSPDKGGAVCSVFEGSINPDEPNSCSTFGTVAGKDKSKCSVFGFGLCSVIAGLANAECTTLLSDQDPNGIPQGTCSTMDVLGAPVAEPVLCSTIVLEPPSVLPPGADGKCAGIR